MPSTFGSGGGSSTGHTVDETGMGQQFAQLNMLDQAEVRISVLRPSPTIVTPEVNAVTIAFSVCLWLCLRFLKLIIERPLFIRAHTRMNQPFLIVNVRVDPCLIRWRQTNLWWEWNSPRLSLVPSIRCLHLVFWTRLKFVVATSDDDRWPVWAVCQATVSSITRVYAGWNRQRRLVGMSNWNGKSCHRERKLLMT